MPNTFDKRGIPASSHWQQSDTVEMQRRAIEILDPNITVAKKKASKILHKSIFTIHKYYRGELMLSLHDYLVILCYLGALQETVKD